MFDLVSIEDPFAEIDIPDLPPVPLPSASALIDAATDSVVLHRITDLVAWVGSGRPLGGDGQLSIDDAAAAAHAVGLGADRPGLAVLVRLARAAGLVRTTKGRLVPVKSRRPLLGRPVDLWHHVFLSFARIGERYAEDEPQFLHPLWHHWPQMLELVNLSLYTAGGDTVPVELLLEITLDAPVGMLGFTPYVGSTAAVKRDWHAHLVDALRLLESLGAVRTELSKDPAVKRRIREVSTRAKPDLTLVALTPIGLWAVNRWLQEQGVPAPAIGELATAGLSELVDRLAMAGPDVVESELAAWVEHRGADRAAAELEIHLRDAAEPAQRLFAMPVLTLCGEAGTAAAHRLRAGGGIPGSIAAGWLLGAGAIDMSAVTVQETMLGVADQLGALAAEGYVAEAFDGQPVADQIRLISELARTAHPQLLDVLDTIADAPVHRKVAKAARAAGQRLRT